MPWDLLPMSSMHTATSQSINHSRLPSTCPGCRSNPRSQSLALYRINEIKLSSGSQRSMLTMSTRSKIPIGMGLGVTSWEALRRQSRRKPRMSCPWLAWIRPSAYRAPPSENGLADAPWVGR